MCTTHGRDLGGTLEDWGAGWRGLEEKKKSGKLGEHNQ